MPEWIVPWIIVGLVIWPLIQVERWIHKHIQGLGLLLTNNPQAAVLVYYVSLLPGVVLHETSQWLLAQILRVKVKKFSLWPEKQSRSKLIRLGLVEIDRKTDTVRTTLIGVIPLVTGITVIALIVGLRFDLTVLLDSLASGDLPIIISGLGAFTSAPDFWLWTYLIFAVGNAMLPEPHDEINWWLIGGIMAGIVVILLVLDLSILLLAGLEGPLADVAKWTSLALLMTLSIDLIGMGLIFTMEVLFSRLLGRRLEYQ